MAFATGTLSALNGVLADLSMPNPLGSTALVDATDARVRACAQRVAGDGSAPVRASRLHDFVRDRIAFGFNTHPWKVRASAVLAAGRGHALPKATLFTALLRAVDIPARLRFVSVQSSLVDGLIRLPTPRYDHAIVEVWLGERWLACDSYAVDTVYFNSACQRLRREGRQWGYGVHVDGRVEWNGRGPSYASLVTGGPNALPPAIDLGVRSDAGALYDGSVREATVFPWATRLGGWRLRARTGNRHIAALRSGAPGLSQ